MILHRLLILTLASSTIATTSLLFQSYLVMKVLTSELLSDYGMVSGTLADDSFFLATPNQTQVIHRCLDWYMKQLQSFIYEAYFDSFSFDLAGIYLSQDLAHLSQLIELYEPLNGKLRNEYQLAENTYHAMSNAAQDLKSLGAIQSEENMLVALVIELNIRVLKLAPPKGDAESVVAYTRQIRLFRDEICCWQTLFEYRSSSSLDLILLFEDYTSQAQETLEKLWSAGAETVDGGSPLGSCHEIPAGTRC
ncbi:hypothetical protein JCM33374_g2226 [Metschnikowia sp. JCM 33374]|nr:hypothetical protein JCM33374_g2226 [Metschnikowia sp. JCM 33374]